MDTNFWIGLLGIIGIDILLAGDNAIVIALACRGLPPEQRKWGMILGSGVAVILRIIFALLIVWLLKIPFLKLIGGLLLFWIAVKLLTDQEGESEISTSDKLWKAVQTIALADLVMSLDNVIAISAMAKGDNTLIMLGILISIPLVVMGSQIIMTLLDKFPLLIWAGAALLGYLAGEMIVTDIKSVDFIASYNPALVNINANPMIGRVPVSWLTHSAGAIGAALVVAIAYFIKSKHKEA